MIPWLLSLFDAPDDQRHDPAGWLGNQAAHALIVGGALVLALWWTGVPALCVAAIYGLWEFEQWERRGARWLDCLTDWLFTASGAVMVQAGLSGDRLTFAAAIGALVAAGLLGVWRRVD